jgi:hypothetical protein
MNGKVFVGLVVVLLGLMFYFRNQFSNSSTEFRRVISNITNDNVRVPLRRVINSDNSFLNRETFQGVFGFQSGMINKQCDIKKGCFPNSYDSSIKHTKLCGANREKSQLVDMCERSLI